MDNLTLNLQQALTFLIYSSAIIFIIIAVFLIRFLMELSGLVKEVQNLTTIINHELEPTLKELKTALENLNNIAKSADNQVHNIQKTLTSLLEPTLKSLDKVKDVSSSFLTGLVSVIKTFNKRG